MPPKGSKIPRGSKQQRLDDGSEAKIARLQRVISLGTTSDAALAKLLQRLEGKQPNKNSLTAARRAKFASMKHVIRVPLQEGGHFDWSMCHPGLLVTRLVEDSPALQAAFKEALRNNPCGPQRPWRLLVGFDEHIPGNKLALNNTRKSMNLSFSFLELGGPYA